MATIWMIRHGQSDGNLGKHHGAADASPLTEIGRRQAEAAVNSATTVPGLLITSPYRRARETAQAFLARYPDTPMEDWPIQEFTFLSRSKYENPETRMGREYVRYWKRSNPDYVDGEGAESFNSFMARVDDLLERIFNTKEQFLVICGHGWFNRAVIWQMMRRIKMDGNRQFSWRKQLKLEHSPPGSAVAKFMAGSLLFPRNWMFHFLIFSLGVSVPNGSIMQFTRTENNLIFDGILADHLPDDIRGSGFLDK